MTAPGGELRGIPVIASSNVPEGLLALIDASAIALGSGGAILNASESATLEMSDTPGHNSTTLTAAQLVSGGLFT